MLRYDSQSTKLLALLAFASAGLLLGSCQPLTKPIPETPSAEARFQQTLAQVAHEDPHLVARGAVINPYAYYGERHNAGFLDVLEHQAPQGGYKQTLLDWSVYLDRDMLAEHRRWDPWRETSPSDGARLALGAGADSLGAAVWEYIASSFGEQTRPPFEAVDAVVRSVETALQRMAPDYPAASLHAAFAVCAVFRASYAMHTGTLWNGVDYGMMAHNPTPYIPPKLDEGIVINYLEIALVDAVGMLVSMNAVTALIASLINLADQIIEGGYTFQDIFGGVVLPSHTPINPAAIHP